MQYVQYTITSLKLRNIHTKLRRKKYKDEDQQRCVHSEKYTQDRLSLLSPWQRDLLDFLFAFSYHLYNNLILLFWIPER